MIRVNLIEDFFTKVQKQEKKLVSFMKYREPETYSVLYYALGALAESYSGAAEESLKGGKSYEATYFSAKATVVRQVASHVFGSTPEKDYYTNLFKQPKDIVTTTSIEELQETASFCAQNLPLDEGIVSDAKKLKPEISKLLRQLPMTGIFAKYGEEMRERAGEAGEKPDKLASVYELVALAVTVQQTIVALRQLSENKEPKPVFEKGEDLKGFRPGK